MVLLLRINGYKHDFTTEKGFELVVGVAAGAIELHFGVFVTLALLLVYQDWKVVVFAAAALASMRIVSSVAIWIASCSSVGLMFRGAKRAAWGVRSAAVDTLKSRRRHRPWRGSRTS